MMGWQRIIHNTVAKEADLSSQVTLDTEGDHMLMIRLFGLLLFLLPGLAGAELLQYRYTDTQSRTRCGGGCLARVISGPWTSGSSRISQPARRNGKCGGSSPPGKPSGSCRHPFPSIICFAFVGLF